MIKDKVSKINRRNKAWLILSFVSSTLFIVGCFICNYKSNIFSFYFSLIIPLFLTINAFFLIYWFVLKQIRYCYIPLISLMLYFLFFSSPLQLNIKQDENIENAFSLMTFNVRAFGSSHNQRNLTIGKKILDFTKKEDPDIICFQEFSRFEFQSFSYYPYKFIGYRSDFEKTLQVIYSKHPIINDGFVDFPNTRNQTIYVDIKFEDEIIRVYNIHLQSYLLRFNKSHKSLQGLRMIANKVDKAQSKQKEQVQIILEHAKTFKGKIIFSGDFNSIQYSTNYKYLKNNKEDSFVKAGFGLGATYPRFNYPFRIDFVLVDNGIEVLSHQNFNLKLSDHEPILTRLVVN